MRNPERVRNLLAYSSLIIRASKDYDDTPWQDYDWHFSKPKEPWSQIDASLWTIYFSRASAKNVHTEMGKNLDSSAKSLKGGEKLVNPYTNTKPICRKWNSLEGCNVTFCRYLHCCIRYSSKSKKHLSAQPTSRNRPVGLCPFGRTLISTEIKSTQLTNTPLDSCRSVRTIILNFQA